MTTKKHTGRRAHQPRNAQGANSPQLGHAGTEAGLPEATALRELWDSFAKRKEFGEMESALLSGVAHISETELGAPLRGVLAGDEAYQALDTIHSELLALSEVTANSFGTAEWIYWLRRLRGQFAGLNTLSSTEPYLQHLAESLVTRSTRPSSALDDEERCRYRFTAETLEGLAVIHHLAGLIYELHSSMKRCAKGQLIRFTPGRLPKWEADTHLDSFIRAYDRRNLADDSGLFVALGVRDYADPRAMPSLPIGGHVPLWHRGQLATDSQFTVSGPPPYLYGSVDFDSVGPLANGQVLDRTQVSLIILLWSCLLAAGEGYDTARNRLTAPFNWGYFLLHTEGTLSPAIDRTITEVHDSGGAAISTAWLPQSARDVLEELSLLTSEVRAPLPGCPVHQVGQSSLIDVVGASSRLVATLRRPKDGPVKDWADRFEQDVQRAIDATPWCPTGDTRTLITKKLKRRDGSELTDIDAVAVRGNRLLLVSCKSSAHTPELARGSFAETRNARERAHKALHDWGERVQAVRDDPGILGLSFPRQMKIDGCVVFPTIPYFTDTAGNRRVFGRVPALLSVSELERVLRRA